MWPVRNVRCFCDDVNEWHALVCGFCFPLWLWPFIIVKGNGGMAELWRTEPWYCGVGMLGRVVGLILLVEALL